MFGAEKYIKHRICKEIIEVYVVFRVERRRMKPRESEKKLNEYWKIAYLKRIVERILCQIVGGFTRKDLVEENIRTAMLFYG